MASKNSLTRTCRHCGTSFTRRSPRGRPPEYCKDACRTAAFRGRTSHAVRAVPAEHEAAVVRIGEAVLRRSQRLHRRSRTFDPSQQLQVLELYAALVRDVHDLGAVLVRQAREYGANWESVGEVLGVSGDAARNRWSAGQVERALEQRAKRGSRPRSPNSAAPPPQAAASGESGPPGRELAGALSDLQRGSTKSVRALAREIGISPSYVSRLLSGERRPSWKVAERFTLACDGDLEMIRPLWDQVYGNAAEGEGSSRRADLTEAATLMQAAMQRMDQAVGRLGAFTEDGTFERPAGRSITSFAWPVAHAHAAFLQGRSDEVCALWDRLVTVPDGEAGGRMPAT
ncbi:helix-turn-helix domain-containing protein [Streptomyces celluloflavus]|uniref:helix-turn-helix domain-containing protein n=1 Tax=Streptomyces celluloflavus TaxID=58344 RepID=UPI003654BFFC